MVLAPNILHRHDAMFPGYRVYSAALHALHICGLLQQTPHVPWSVSAYVPNKTAKPIEMTYGDKLVWVKGTMYYIRVRGEYD